MAIGERATEFAGLPVIDYHPAVGLVLSTMPRREFRRADGTAEKFWAITLDRERLTIQFGGVGNAGDTDTQSFPTAAAAQEDYRKLIASILREGYVEQKTEGGSLREALAAAIRADPDDAASRNAFADYLAEQGEALPAAAYRVEADDWDEVLLPRLEALLAEPAAGLVQALVIGWWGGEESDAGPEEVIAALVAARDRLASLRALFLGDIPFTTNEISWIFQADLTDLFTAFGKLEHFRSRGGTDLALRPFRHEHLKSLALEASNMPRDVVRVVGECDLPALEHLELWLGTDRYGADTEVSDLEGIFQGKHLPSLRDLGLRNSEIADDITAALARAPVLERLRVLDLSLGTLSDAGAQALLAIPAVRRLEKLDIHHHFVSDEMMERLRGLGIEVDAGDPQDPDDDYRYVAHSE
jgi:uncharacterized protein (TIGR02996 family)